MLQASSRTAYETRTITVGFALDLPSGVTLTSATVTAEAGPLPATVTDPNPSATLSGGASINSQPLTINTPGGAVVQQPGQAILQTVQAGLAGANYVYRFRGARSDGQTCEADVLQQVTPYVPTP